MRYEYASALSAQWRPPFPGFWVKGARTDLEKKENLVAIAKPVHARNRPKIFLLAVLSGTHRLDQCELGLLLDQCKGRLRNVFCLGPSLSWSGTIAYWAYWGHLSYLLYLRSLAWREEESKNGIRQTITRKFVFSFGEGKRGCGDVFHQKLLQRRSRNSRWVVLPRVVVFRKPTTPSLDMETRQARLP